MFFNRRVLQAEYFDALDRPAAELAEAYATLAGVNRIFLLARPFQRLLPVLAGPERCRSLSLLDLGAGDGSLGVQLSAWAANRGWDWRITNVDVNLRALRLNPAGQSIVGSALALPFRDETFDAVIASQMAHHLDTDEEVSRHFREAWRVAKLGVVFNDLHRNVLFCAALWLVLRLRGCPGHFISDAMISVRRGWRVQEWRALAGQAGIPGARVSLSAGARVILYASRRG